MKKAFRFALAALAGLYVLVCTANPFAPGKTVTLSASTSSSSSPIIQGSPQVVVHNAGSVTVFIKFGVGSATATTSDYPVLAGATETLSKRDADTVGVITGSSTATVYVTSGDGE